MYMYIYGYFSVCMARLNVSAGCLTLSVKQMKCS